MSDSDAVINGFFQAAYKSNGSDFNAASAYRMMNLIGLSCLLYDHVLTFRDEVKYIWRGALSPGKVVFLLNRYIVVLSVTTAYIASSGYIGIEFTNQGCQRVLSTLFVLGVLSMSLADVLVLLRVVALWEGKTGANWFLLGGFLVSFATMLTCFIRTWVYIFPHVVWSPPLNVCMLTATSPLLIGVWASGMAFELLVLAATCWNAYDRPRTAQEPVLRGLRNDGIVYFSAIACSHLFSMCLASTNNPKRAFLGIYLMWSIISIFLNRLVLNAYAAEPRQDAPKGSLPLAMPSLVRPAQTGPVLHSRTSWRDLRDGTTSQTRSRGSAKDGADPPDTEDSDKAWELGPYRGVEIGKVEWAVEDR